MSKQTREEEQKILAQMEEAMREEGQKAQTEEKSVTDSPSQATHCYRCKTLMEDGVCPTCGFKLYVPISEEKREKIKKITTVIGFAVFIVVFIVFRLSKS